MSVLSRLLNVFRSSHVEAALDDEMQFHIDTRADELVAAGMTRRDAELAASRQFGNRLRLRESSRDIKLLPWLDSVFKDIRFAVRMLRKHFVVSAAAIASLTLAIGPCLAAFSLVDALILRPLPVPDPEQLFYLTFPTYSSGSPLGSNFSYPLFMKLRDAAGHGTELFAASSDENRRRANFSTAAQEEEVRVQFVSGNALPVLGVRPAAGRLLAPSDDFEPAGRPVAVLSHAFWRRRFGSDAAVVGTAFTLGERRFEIVGVTQESFTGI
jgi:hypothetical protein